MYQVSDIEILIATMNRDDLGFLEVMFSKTDVTKYNILIINQTTTEKQLHTTSRTIKVINVLEKGLSKSRNLALRSATKKLVVFTDDDVVFEANFDTTIINAFNDYPNFDGFRFPFQMKEGVFAKKYSSTFQSQLSAFDILNTSSVELVFKKEAIQSARLHFDENFGLGSPFYMGEEAIFEQTSFITFKEIIPTVNNQEIIPNSAQHNVPAWALFAIFFIVVPLSINIVKEKGQGTMIRLLTNPVPYYVVVAGKTATYLIICLIQFLLMLAVGVFVFPHLGLPVLDVEGKIILMSIVALFSGLAAIGFGILLGTIAKTQEQSAPFGATSVVILAAIGGVWVPVFAMPKIMQYVSHISPMNWGLNAFYDVLLRNGNILDILPELFFLLLFFILTTSIAIIYDKKKRAV